MFLNLCSPCGEGHYNRTLYWTSAFGLTFGLLGRYNSSKRGVGLTKHIKICFQVSLLINLISISPALSPHLLYHSY